MAIKSPKENFHMSSRRLKKIKSTPIDKQSVSAKPEGFWYSCGHEWLKWLKSEMPHWDKKYYYQVDVDYSRVLRLTTYKDLIEFTKKYGQPTLPKFKRLKLFDPDWKKIAEEYSGIEICPYVHQARFKLLWYYTWDVASGCIWDASAIKGLKLVSKPKDAFEDGENVEEQVKFIINNLLEEEIGSVTGNFTFGRDRNGGNIGPSRDLKRAAREQGQEVVQSTDYYEKLQEMLPQYEQTGRYRDFKDRFVSMNPAIPNYEFVVYNMFLRFFGLDKDEFENEENDSERAAHAVATFFRNIYSL